MIIIKTRIERKSLVLSAKAMREVVKAGYAHIGRYWHRVLLPKHFRHGAKQEYSYQPRDRWYLIRKARKFGHQLPLVFTGTLQSMVMGYEDVRASAKGVRVVLHGPPHLYKFRKDYNQPDKAEELTRISRADKRILAQELDKFITKKAKGKGGGIDVGRPIGAQVA